MIIAIWTYKDDANIVQHLFTCMSLSWPQCIWAVLLRSGAVAYFPPSQSGPRSPSLPDLRSQSCGENTENQLKSKTNNVKEWYRMKEWRGWSERDVREGKKKWDICAEQIETHECSTTLPVLFFNWFTAWTLESTKYTRKGHHSNSLNMLVNLPYHDVTI